MKILIILLLFFSFEEVSAKTITTPYLSVGSVDSSYQVKDNEKVEKVTYYKQEKIDKSFKYLKDANSEYSIKTNDIKYGEYGDYQEKRKLNKMLDEDSKTIYYYKELKKIDSLVIKDINNLLITNITLRYKDNIIYEGDNHNINLSKEYSPEYLVLEVTCFLNQEDLKGTFVIESDNFISSKVEVKEKGYSEIEIKLINSLTKTIYDDKVLKTSNIDDKFYINVIDKKILYRYRNIYYKCYKDESLIDTKIHDGYRVVDVIDKYYLYRKETLEVYDDINLSNYLDLSKVIKYSSIPLGKLDFIYDNKNCGKSVLTIKYQDYEMLIDVTFNCDSYDKSKVVHGKTKSLKREIFGILFKTLFLRIL